MTLEEVIRGIDERLPKWRAWFPDEGSLVEIPRRDLLLLVEAARPKPPAPDPFHRGRPEVFPGAGWCEIETTDQKLLLRPGHEVAVRMDDGARRAFVVARGPWPLGHGEYVIGLEGISGGYLLDRVLAVRKAVGGE